MALLFLLLPSSLPQFGWLLQPCVIDHLSNTVNLIPGPFHSFLYWRHEYKKVWRGPGNEVAIPYAILKCYFLSVLVWNKTINRYEWVHLIYSTYLMDPENPAIPENPEFPNIFKPNPEIWLFPIFISYLSGCMQDLSFH